jgi:hypothetical protein
MGKYIRRVWSGTSGPQKWALLSLAVVCLLAAWIVKAVDTDGDGLTDAEETGIFGTNPDLADSNANGTNDLYLIASRAGTDTCHRAGTWIDRWADATEADIPPELETSSYYTPPDEAESKRLGWFSTILMRSPLRLP